MTSAPGSERSPFAVIGPIAAAILCALAFVFTGTSSSTTTTHSPEHDAEALATSLGRVLPERPERVVGDLAVVTRLEQIELALRGAPSDARAGIFEPDPTTLLVVPTTSTPTVIALADDPRSPLAPTLVTDNDDAPLVLTAEHTLLTDAIPSDRALANRRPRDGVRHRHLCLGDNADDGDDLVVDVQLQPTARLLALTLHLDGERYPSTIAVPLPGAAFAMAVHCRPDTVRVFVGGIETGPLERSHGAFFHIDSAIHVVDVDRHTGAVTHRPWPEDVVPPAVTPKALVFDDDHHRLYVAGAASGDIAVLEVEETTGVLKVVDTLPGLVGASDLVRLPDGHTLAVVSPLTDAVAFVDVNARTRRLKPLPGPRRSPLVRVGEALLTTTALAPEQKSDGPTSTFSCEACHLDLGVDGRLHRTGRLDDDGHEIVTSTKPLWNVFANPPLFSRGLDRSVGAMVDAEIGVANAHTPRGPWTPIDIALEAPFLTDVVDVVALREVTEDGRLSPWQQRVAMLFALAAQRPPVSDAAVLDDDEARGWQVFRGLCLSCHQPRRFADDASSAVDIDVLDDAQQRRRLLAAGDLVWASTVRADVGVRPLVHPEGARTSSLRRIARKRPLLTNGAAVTLEAFVRGLRLGPAPTGVSTDAAFVWHDGHDVVNTNDGGDGGDDGDVAVVLSEADRDALLAFLLTL